MLTYHVVSGTVLSTDLTDGDVPTVEGGTVKVTTDPITINGANVIFANLVASNGVVHLYVEVVDAAGGSPKSVITQSRAVSAFSGPFTGISCRPCK